MSHSELTTTFRKFLADNQISPRIALLLAQAAIMEDKVKELASNVGFDGNPLD